MSLCCYSIIISGGINAIGSGSDAAAGSNVDDLHSMAARQGINKMKRIHIGISYGIILFTLNKNS